MKEENRKKGGRGACHRQSGRQRRTAKRQQRILRVLQNIENTERRPGCAMCPGSLLRDGEHSQVVGVLFLRDFSCLGYHHFSLFYFFDAPLIWTLGYYGKSAKSLSNFLNSLFPRYNLRSRWVLPSLAIFCHMHCLTRMIRLVFCLTKLWKDKILTNTNWREKQYRLRRFKGFGNSNPDWLFSSMITLKQIFFFHLYRLVYPIRNHCDCQPI